MIHVRRLRPSWTLKLLEKPVTGNLVAMHPQFLIAAVLCFAAALSLSAQDKAAISLPADNSTTIVVLDFRGGYGPPRKNQDPVLTIQADGNATVVDPMGERPTRKYTLSSAEVQDLLRDIVYEQNSFRIDRAEVSRAMEEEDRKTGTSMSIIDAATTVIRVKTADREQELRFNALGTWANRYPTIQPLQQLFNVEKRLERLIAEFSPGVRETIAIALNAVNDAMKREHPGQQPLTLNDFQFTGGETSGPHTTQFLRVQTDRSTLSATVTRSPGMLPRVTIEITPQARICYEGEPPTCFPFDF